MVPKPDIHVDLTKLPVAAERPPANVELVPPAPALEAQMAMRSKASEQAARAAMSQGMRVAPNLAAAMAQSRPAPAPEPPSAEELAEIKARVKKPQVKEAVPTPAVNPTIAGAAHIIVDHLCSLSGEWGAKIAAMRAERGMRDDQIASSLIASALDMNMHMTVTSDHPYFAEQFKAAGTNYECILCGEVGSRLYAGQPPICQRADNRCANRFRALPENEQKELLELAA